MGKLKKPLTAAQRIMKLRKEKEKRVSNRLEQAAKRAGVHKNKTIMTSTTAEHSIPPVTKPISPKVSKKKNKLFVRFSQGGSPGLGKKSIKSVNCCK